MTTKKSNSRLIITAIAAVVVVACCALVCLATVLLVSCQPPTLTEINPSPTVRREVRMPSATPTRRQSQPPEPTAEHTPSVVEPTALPAATDETTVEKPTSLPSPTSERTAVEATPIPLASTEERLAAAVLPIRDMRDLALRLRAEVDEIPVVVNLTPPQFEEGDVETFWVGNVDTDEHFQIEAVLRVKLPHVYMWVERGVDVDMADLRRSARRFEEDSYPTDRAFFGSEWSPGVDNDVHLSILNATNLGDHVAGYFSSADEFSQLANRHSNEKEMFYINLDNNPPGTLFYDGTLAHELQHMIHWANDRNEDTWVNEGCAELATELNGYNRGGADVVFSDEPDTQLTTWTDDPSLNTAHYGSAYLFMSYFLDRFGDQLTQAVVASPADGPAGFDDALAAAGYELRFDDIFADWLLANYLDSRTLEGGRYGYQRDNPEQVALEARFRRFPVEEESTVSQYAADYYELAGRGDVVIDFCGANETRLVATDARSGRSAWWSHRADDSDTRLTRSFDLRTVNRATLEYWLWYDVEEGYDYGYVQVSADGGKSWHVLEGVHTWDYDPVGNAFGVGYTGKSGDPESATWVFEQLDLTPYAGQEVLVRFEYVTDDAVTYPGLLLDDIAIPELGYFDDAEAGEAGWNAEGWVLTDNHLTQRWVVQLIEQGPIDTSVRRMEMDDEGCGYLVAENLGRVGRKAVLAVSALAPVTTEAAPYRFKIQTQQVE